MGLLFDRVLTEIDNHSNNCGSISREQYEDDYDGFTHSTYTGLANEVVNELYEDGYSDNVSNSVIEEYVSQMF